MNDCNTSPVFSICFLTTSMAPLSSQFSTGISHHRSLPIRNWGLGKGGKESLYELNILHTTDISRTSLTPIVFAASVKHRRSLSFRNLRYLTVNTHQHSHPIFDHENQKKPRSPQKSSLPQSPTHWCPSPIPYFLLFHMQMQFFGGR